jgi:hypothetical protein
LLEPAGDLSLAYFPGKPQEDVDALLGAYIADGVARLPAAIAADPVAASLAVTAWSYHRAYRNIALRLSRDPSTVRVEGEFQTTITAEQIRTFKVERDNWLAEWNAAIATGDASTAADPGTVALPNSYSF